MPATLGVGAAAGVAAAGVAAAAAATVGSGENGETGPSSGIVSERGAGSATNEQRILAICASLAPSPFQISLSSARCGSSASSFSCCECSADSGSESTWNLSLHLASGGSFSAASCTVTSASAPGHATPTLGRTLYRFGFVVLILNVTPFSAADDTETRSCCFDDLLSVTGNLRSGGSILTPESVGCLFSSFSSSAIWVR